jgi:putative ABC transport system ATP-binding protein
MISARHLSKAYREADGRAVPILEGASLEIARGDFVAVTGPSGSGKSTLLQLVGGLDLDFSGELEVAGQRLRGLDDVALSRFRNASIGFVFQSFHLLPHLDARSNVALPAHFAGGPVARDVERAEAALARVGLSGKARRMPAQLSGGERQRVALARALFMEPPLLLCDEPTGNLDAASGAEVRALLVALHAQGQTLVVVTHDPAMAAVASRRVRLEGGALVEEGP